MSGNDSFALFDSVKSVRDLLQRRLDDGAGLAQGELEAGLHEIEALWEELRQRADELAGERQRYSEFFEYAPDAYLVTDSHGTVREANRAAAEMLGVPARTLAGKPLVNCVHEDGRREFRAYVVRASAQPDGEVSVWRGVLLGPQGVLVPAQFRVRAMPVADGGLAPLCWLVRRS
jgi:PAS domain S-box-containing protein